MNVALICLQFLSCLIVSTFAQYPFQFTNPASPVKRTYVLHRGANGEPRYTPLVRRNFLRFGKRSGGVGGKINRDPTDYLFDRSVEDEFDKSYNGHNKEEMGNVYKRARDYLRFGKRAEEEEDGLEDLNEDDIDSPDMARLFPYKRFGRRRMSNFLRFG